MESYLLADTSTTRDQIEDDHLATFMSNDPSYFVFRRFRTLNLRNLLQLQANVLVLQQQIETLKTQSANGNAARQGEQLMLAVDEALYRYSASPGS